jgi:hypothetical protein
MHVIDQYIYIYAQYASSLEITKWRKNTSFLGV